MKRIAIAAVLVAVVALVGYDLWWTYGPWPLGTVVEVQSSEWVIVQTDEGIRYRAWVPEDSRSDSLLGEYVLVHNIGSLVTAEPVPW